MKVSDRAAEYGVQSLSDAELMHLITGQDCAEKVGGLRAIIDGTATGTAATKLRASIELGRRAMRHAEDRPVLRTPTEIHAYLEPKLAGLAREEFWVLAFNTRNKLIAEAKVAQGSTIQCAVDPREVFAFAVKSRAVAIVIAHNHPAGDPEPSTSDIALTTQLRAGAEVLGIKLLDHLVIGAGRYASFVERGMLR